MVLLCVGAGCETTPKRTPTPTRSVLRITNHVGGAHYRTIVHEELWYQTFSNELLVIDTRTAQPVASIELGTFGECGPAVELALVNEHLYAVLENDQVVVLSIIDPAAPQIIERYSAEQLGLSPRRLSVVTENGSDVVYVCGDGGARNFDGGPLLFAGMGEVQSVANAEMGLVGTIGRRVYRADDQTYVGGASKLMPLPGDDAGGMVFEQQGETGALIGIMDANVRERHARNLTTAIGGAVRRVRCFDGSIWIVTDEQILAYTPTDDDLELRDVFRVRGALDVDMIRENYLAVAGTFGRAIYRIRDDSQGRGDTFVLSEREPGLLRYAISDRLQILAGTSEQGTWLYRIGSEAILQDKTMSDGPEPSREAVSEAGTATIGDEHRMLEVRRANTTLRWQHPKGHGLHCVIAIEGRFWIGHEWGVSILEVDEPTAEEIKQAEKDELPPPQPRLTSAGEVWLHGPVRYLFALLTGRGAAYVATYGGLGTVEFIEEPIPTPASGTNPG